jgi:hypothetical protein
MTETVRDDDWQRLTWHKRSALVNELAKRALILRHEIEVLAAERADLERANEAARNDLASTIDLRGHKSNLKVIWSRDSQWSPTELKAAHAAYARGVRDEWTVAGQHVYDRQRQLRKRNAERERARRARGAA